MPDINTIPNSNQGRRAGVGAATCIHGGGVASTNTTAVADEGQVQIPAAYLPDPPDNLIAMNAHRLRIQYTLPQPFCNHTIPLVMPTVRQEQLPPDREVPLPLGLEFSLMAPSCSFYSITFSNSMVILFSASRYFHTLTIDIHFQFISQSESISVSAHFCAASQSFVHST
jgi:hypothetical protein